MGKTDRITERQLSVLIFVSLLSPMIRILPASAVLFAGRSAWLSTALALPAGAALVGFTRWARKNAPEEMGLADMALAGLGPVAGRAFDILCALWLTFYGGFIARSAAERLLATVYPNGNTPVFIVVMLAVALFTASGLTKTLSRTAEILMPILGAVIAVVLLSALPDVSAGNLLPVTYRDLKAMAYGALPIFDVMAASGYFLFLAGRVRRPKAQKPNAFPWLILLAAVAFGVTFFTLGTLGEKLAVSMENAFFMVVRNIKVLGVVERMEAVVVTVWIVTDFIFLAAVLMIVAEIWRTVTGAKKRAVFVAPSAALSGAAAFLVAGNAFAFQRWSDFIVPAVNLLLAAVLIPAVMAGGKLIRRY